MCGTSPWEWEEDRYAYEPITKQCWGCYIRDGADQDTDRVLGSRVVLVPQKQAEKLQNKENKRPER